MSEELGVPFLGAIPIDPEIVTGGDEGRPIVTNKPDSQVATAYLAIATQLAKSLDATPETVLEPFVWSWADDKAAPPWLESATTSEGGPIIPVGLRRRDPRTLSILWQNGQRHDYDVRDLLDHCDDTAGHQPAYRPSRAPDVREGQSPHPRHYREHEQLHLLALWGNDGHLPARGRSSHE